MTPETSGEYSHSSIMVSCLDYVRFADQGNASIDFVGGPNLKVELNSYMALFPNPDKDSKILVVIPDQRTDEAKEDLYRKLIQVDTLPDSPNLDDDEGYRKEEYFLHRMGYPMILVGFGKHRETGEDMIIFVHPKQMSLPTTYAIMRNKAEAQLSS